MSAVQNHLIELLPEEDRRRLLALCVPVELRIAEVLSERGQATRHVYFPTEGFISLIVPSTGHPGLEVGMVGREGMLGAQLVLGVDASPLQALVQGAGGAWRIEAEAFVDALTQIATLRQVLLRYIYVRMSQLSASAACLRFHLIGPRLARWLLMSQDRAHADRFDITHEFLAYMLGVRRVGITMAAGVLQRSGLIEYHRGNLLVVDRAGLEAVACCCYAEDREVYATVMAAEACPH